MENCIFCKIAKGEMDCYKIWEDQHFMAFLDAFPNTKGQVVVIPKFHQHADVFKMESYLYGYFMDAVKKVVEIMKKGLGVERISMVMEGMGVSHAHIKLYPMRGVTEDRKLPGKQFKIFFEEYMGFIVTKSGPKASVEELKALSTEIMNKSMNLA